MQIMHVLISKLIHFSLTFRKMRRIESGNPQTQIPSLQAVHHVHDVCIEYNMM